MLPSMLLVLGCRLVSRRKGKTNISRPKSSVVAFTTLFAAGEKAQLAKVPGVTAEVIAAATIGSQWGYAHATHLVFGVSIAFGVATVLCSLFLGSLKKYTTAGTWSDIAMPRLLTRLGIDVHRGL